MNVAADRLPEKVHTNTLPWWRAALRRRSVRVRRGGGVGERGHRQVVGVGAFVFLFFFPSQHFFLLDCPPPAVLAKARDG